MIRYEGKLFRSLEHAFQYTKLIDAGYAELAEESRGMRNPHHVRLLGNSIQTPKKWRKRAVNLMDELIQLKFDQNPDLKDKLMELPHRKFYEMTRDKLWATGRRITKTDRVIEVTSLEGGKNVVGKAITRVKNGYILDEIRQGKREPEGISELESETSACSSQESSTEDSGSDTAVED